MFAVAGALMLLGGMVSLLFTRERHRRPAGPFRPRPLRDLARIARIPDVPVLYAGGFMFAMTLFGSISVISIFTVQLLGGADGRVDVWVGAAALAVTVSSGLAVHGWGRFMDRAGPAPALAAGLLLGAAGMVPVALVRTPLELVAARALTGLLIAGIVPAQVAMTRLRAPEGMEARVLAYGTTFTILGMGAGPLLAGWIGPRLGLRAYFALNAAALLAVGLLWLRCMRRAKA